MNYLQLIGGPYSRQPFKAEGFPPYITVAYMDRNRKGLTLEQDTPPPPEATYKTGMYYRAEADIYLWEDDYKKIQEYFYKQLDRNYHINQIRDHLDKLEKL